MKQTFASIYFALHKDRRTMHKRKKERKSELDRGEDDEAEAAVGDDE